jgi:hypothetical protein
MRNRLGKSYEYNVICDVCGFKFKNHQLSERWDGRMVCKEDYETRHIADFYTTPNDTHALPFIRGDNQRELTWSPTNITLTQNTGSATLTGTYSYEQNDTVISFQVEVAIIGNATSTSLGSFISLPVISVASDPSFSSGTSRLIDSSGRFYGSNNIGLAATTFNTFAWTNVNRSIIISGSYKV